MLAAPDQLAVFVYFLYTVQRDAVQYIIVINQIKREMVIRFEESLTQWNADYTIIKPVTIFLEFYHAVEFLLVIAESLLT